MSRLHLFLLSIVLISCGVGIAAYKAVVLGYPLSPGATDDLWVVETHLAFRGQNRSAKASVYIPQQSPMYILEDESFVSQGFGLSTLLDGGNRLAVWAIRKVTGSVDLYYRTVIREAPAYDDDQALRLRYSGKRPKATRIKLEGMEKDAAESLLKHMSAVSADQETLARQVLKHVSHPEPRSAEKHLIGPRATALRRAVVATQVLNLAGVPARTVQGLALEESLSDVTLKPRVEVFFDNHWHLFNPVSGEQVTWRFFLPWYRGSKSVSELQGGRGLKQVISVQRMQEAAVSGALHLSRISHPVLSAFSLYRLPVEVQSVYKVLLMIPVGAFLIVLLRNLVGLATLGTFMPVLIALSFRESDPIWGGLLFSGIVGVALVVRAYFEHLRLLLVPRLASVLTVIVVLMLFASLLLNSLGVERGLSVALFPMVILTMVVERMSILWDELGPRKAIRQGLFTLLVSFLVYYITDIPMITHLMFVFPELLLVILAVNLVLGRYTGYRLVELYRFRSLARSV